MEDKKNAEEKSVGLISNNVISKNRIMDQLGDKGYLVTNISTNIFDPAAFDAIIVDLESPMAELVLKNYGYKCIAFGSKDSKEDLEMAQKWGCDKVFKHGEFFKKFLPRFQI